MTADAELLRSRQAFPLNYLVPTPAMLQGDFRGLNQINDPRSANAQRIKQPFPNNMVPADRISPFAKLYNDFLLTSPLSPRDPDTATDRFVRRPLNDEVVSSPFWRTGGTVPGVNCAN